MTMGEVERAVTAVTSDPRARELARHMDVGDTRTVVEAYSQLARLHCGWHPQPGLSSAVELSEVHSGT
jgi:hypothetical protein